MKTLLKDKILFIVFLFALVVFTGCKEGDGDADYGFAYIYMPQATASGGLNNEYNVPSGGGEYTYNFRVDKESNKLNIMLGVIRSGKVPDSSFSVDVLPLPGNTHVDASANQMLLPESMYTLPSTVTVPEGKSNNSFYLSVDINSLKSDTYTGKKLLLTVGIDKPTKFQLSETNTQTLVIIDVDAIREHLK